MTAPAGGALVAEIPPPAPVGAMAPGLHSSGRRLFLTWIEPRESGGHRLRFSRYEAEGWSVPGTIAEGDDFFANWADVPSLVDGGDALFAHWLAKTAPDPYAYSIRLARSADGGTVWEAAGTLHHDEVPAEHGFVSFVTRGEGLPIRAFWLDGREMPAGGPMALRTRLLAAEPQAEQVLDARVCECCPTDAAQTAAGEVVVYRDRSPEEVRDIHIVRRTADGWSEPAPVHRDGWRIAGCPVNGPAVDADGERLAVAWFTAAAGRPAVRVVFSADAGASFGTPVAVDAESPLGRVDLVLETGGSAVVSWLASAGEGAEVRLQRVTADGWASEPLVVATTSAVRSSGIPRLAAVGDRLGVALVEVRADATTRLRFFELPTRALGRPPAFAGTLG